MDDFNGRRIISPSGFGFGTSDTIPCRASLVSYTREDSKASQTLSASEDFAKTIDNSDMAPSIASIMPPPPPKWVLDLDNTMSSKPKASSFPDPPGFAAVPSGSKRGAVPGKQQSQTPGRKPPSTDELDTLKLKKAWEMAIAPAKQLPMNAIGMYMTGNSLQIFSIFMLFTLFKTPIQAIMNLNNTFSRLESEGIKSKIIAVKLVFILTNSLALAMGIYKVNAMGLLPTTRSDWLAWERQRMPLERAYPAFDML